MRNDPYTALRAGRGSWGFFASVAVHVVFAGLLVMIPKEKVRKVRSVDMDVVNTPRPEIEQPEEPEPEVPEKAPEPEARKPRPRKKPVEKTPPATPPPEQAAPEPPPEQAEALPPPTFNMSNDSFAKKQGQGAAWSLDAAEGDSTIGVVRSRFEELPEKTAPPGQGVKGATGEGGFAPAAPRELSRRPEVARQVVIPYPDEARRKNIEGTVIMSVEIKKDGTVRSVRVLKDPGGGLGEAAKKALMRFRFSPARNKQGRKVDYRLVYKYTFVLE